MTQSHRDFQSVSRRDFIKAAAALSLCGVLMPLLGLPQE
ncbi:MAG: twin-arginine translocation signal domain-containing protein, partial [Nitrospirae bacterium]|nr:twin-arginine translocation signal domain-containing protein [Nitrospirota bacterium]